ncbi:MAG: hypothetical protein WAW41_07920 [Methylobacter sp.]
MPDSSPPPASTSSNTTTTPWAKAVPYLVGQKDKQGVMRTGIFPSAENFFSQYNTLNPQQQGLNDAYSGTLNQRDSQIGQLQDVGQDFMSGQYDPTAGDVTGQRIGYRGSSYYPTARGVTGQKINAYSSAYNPTSRDVNGQQIAYQGSNYNPTARDVAGQQIAYHGATYNPTARDVNGQQVSLQAARAGQGALDPTRAMQDILSGRPDNPYLAAMHQGNINDSLRGYQDAMTMMGQQVMPGLEDQAFASGQYGSSRQGVAEGLALQQAARNARDLGIAAMDSGNQLFGSAYENAQGRKAQAADSLNQMGLQNAQYNSDLMSRLGQFNANLAMGKDAARLQNAQFNSSNDLSAQQYNSGLLAQLGQFNADMAMNKDAARLQNAQFNATNNLGAQQYNSDLMSRLGQFNANLATTRDAARLQNSQFNIGNNLASQQYNSGLLAQLGQFNSELASNQDAARLQNLQFNAGNDLSAQQYNSDLMARLGQFNANLDLQQSAAGAQNAQQGFANMQQVFGLEDNTFNQLQALLQAPQNQYQNALNQYASIVSPGAGMGGSSVSSAQVPIYGSGGAQIIGGGLGLAGLLSSLGQ